MPRVIPGVADVHLRWSGPEGQKCEHVYSYHYNSTPTVAHLIALANDLAGNFTTTFTKFLTNACVLRELFIKDIGEASDRAEWTRPYGIGVVGLHTNDTMPLNAAVQITLRTGRTGRSNHGAKSYSGFDEQQVTRDIAQNQLLTDIAAHGVEVLLIRNPLGVVYDPVVASLKLHNYKSLGSFFIPDENIDSRKTRLVGHGR